MDLREYEVPSTDGTSRTYQLDAETAKAWGATPVQPAKAAPQPRNKQAVQPANKADGTPRQHG